jgi:integrase
VPYQERGAWSAQELRAFLEATSEDRLAAMWLLFATTGMRRGELLGLPWRAVDLDTSPGRLAVVQTVVVVDKQPVVVAEAKTTTSRRQLALDPFTVAALKAHRVRQLEERLAWGPAWVDTGLVFTGEDGQVLHPEHVTKRFARLVRDTGLPPITLHGVRHSYATAALASRSRWSPSGWGMPAPRSPPTCISTCCRVRCGLPEQEIRRLYQPVASVGGCSREQVG